MKETEFERKDGSKGYNYKPEVNDVVIALAEKVFVRENPAIVEGRAVIIKNYGIQVRDNDGKEFFLTITEGQKKELEKNEPLTNKTIQFEEYENKYGKQIGARVVKNE